MKQPQHITFSGVKKIPTRVASWALELSQLHRPSLCTTAARRRALPTCKAVSCSTERKTWQLAEQAREVTPYGMQRLLSCEVWDTEGVRDEPLAPMP